MKKFAFIILSSIFTFATKAQTFNIEIEVSSGEIEEGLGVAFANNKYYFLGLGRTNGVSPFNLGMELIITDQIGNIENSYINKQNQMGIYAARDHSFIIKNNEELIFVTSIRDYSNPPSAPDKAMITSYDTALNINWQRIYFNVSSFFRTVQITPEGHFLVLGETGNIGNGLIDILLMKLDTLGNEIWRQTYGGVADDGAMSLRILADGNYLIGGFHEYTNVPDMDGWLIKTDTAGNVLWENYLESPGADYGIHIFAENYFYQAKDTFYTYPGGPSYLISYFGAFNNLGEVIWTDEFEQKEGQNIKCALELNDGGILIVQDYIDYDYQGQVSWLIKYDENRNKIWERYYFADNARSNGLVDVAEDDDGNLVFIGTILTTDTLYNADIWLLKLNADGCLDATDCGEPIGILDLTLAKEVFGIQVNPNPVKEQAKIIIKNSANFIGEDLSISIYNAAGKQVHQQSEKLRGQLPAIDLDVSNYPKGVYYIKASINGIAYGNGKFVKE